jgi:hypothetical protein
MSQFLVLISERKMKEALEMTNEILGVGLQIFMCIHILILA